MHIETQIQKHGETIKGGHAKIDRYKWVVLDQRGKQQDISKHALLVDLDYQRQSEDGKVLRLAREWSWIAAGVIVVAQRDDGSFYVIDGFHRVLAARKRSDITTLPCLVFEVDKHREEALGFLRANCNRKNVTAVDKFKAQVITENENALLVKNLIEQSGRVISKGGTGQGVKCVALLMKLAETNRAEFLRMWPIIVEISEGSPISERVTHSLVYIESKLPEGQTLSSGDFRKRVFKAGAVELNKAAMEAAAFYKRGGVNVWVKGVLNRLNRGCRNHIKLASADDGDD